MKKFLIALLTIFFATMLFAQNRNCPTVIDLAQMQIQDPARYQRFMDLETFTANYVANQGNPNQRLINSNGLITIPVVVHVLHRGEAEGTGRNISFAQIQSQIDVLNEDFRRLNADRVNTPAAFAGVASDYNFEFRLACQDPAGNPSNGVVRRQTNKNTFTFISIPNTPGFPNENAMGIKMSNISGSDPWPTNSYLNIWVADFNDGTLGYATPPADFVANPNVDGVVIETTSMGRTGNVIAPFDRGRTATHEIGHWLNLRHINGDAICGDDFVGDTPQQRNQNFGCPGFPHPSNCQNNGPTGDMFMNYMDYTDDGCMNIYTNGQRLRGRAIFAAGGPRAAFVDNYFSIQQPGAINCIGNVGLNNPNCFPVTWSVISGPATISNPTNAGVTLNASAVGTVTLRATGGNYISDLNINVNQNVPTAITGSYLNPNFSGGVLQSGQSVCAGTIRVNIDEAQATTYSWQRVYGSAPFIDNGVYADITLASSESVSFQITATNPCGSTARTVNFIADDPQCGGYFRFSVSPNPVKGNMNVVFEQLVKANENITMRLYEINSSTIVKQWNLKGGQKQYSLNKSGLKSGQYILEATIGTSKVSKQVIID